MQRKLIIANGNFEHLTFPSEYLSIGVKEKGCSSRPEISEYCFNFKIQSSMILLLREMLGNMNYTPILNTTIISDVRASEIPKMQIHSKNLRCQNWVPR